MQTLQTLQTLPNHCTSQIFKYLEEPIPAVSQALKIKTEIYFENLFKLCLNSTDLKDYYFTSLQNSEGLSYFAKFTMLFKRLKKEGIDTGIHIQPSLSVKTLENYASQINEVNKARNFIAFFKGAIFHPIYQKQAENAHDGETEIVKSIRLQNWMEVNKDFLGKLRHLSLAHIGLYEIPPQIKYFTNVTKLQLEGNRLKQLPAEIGELKKLWELNLSYNNLESLPREISQFSELQRLYLSNNKLSSLPPEINLLGNELRYVDLRNNELSSLPLLDQLREADFDFRGNYFVGFPEKLRVLEVFNKENFWPQRVKEEIKSSSKEKQPVKASCSADLPIYNETDQDEPSNDLQLDTDYYCHIL